MKKKDAIIIIIIAIVGFIVGFGIYKLSNGSQKMSLVDSNDNCKILSVSKKYKSYSFDGGQNWTDNNYVEVCQNSVVTVLAKKNDGNVVNYGTVNVDIDKKIEDKSMSFSDLGYTCRDGEFIRTVVRSNGTGVATNFSSSNKGIAKIEKDKDYSVKCIDCVAVKISCLKKGNTNITASNDSGVTTNSNVEVTVGNTGKMIFENNKYTCTTGSSIDNVIISNIEGQLTSYGSNDSSIATVEDSLNQVKCVGCHVVKINCLKDGSTSIYAKTAKEEATAMVDVSTLSEVTPVTPEESVTPVTPVTPVNTVNITPKISFDKNTYYCTKGNSFTTVISSDYNDGVKSFSSSNTNIATITKSSSMVKCAGCLAVDVKCVNTGTATLTAQSNKGATVSVPLSVK